MSPRCRLQARAIAAKARHRNARNGAPYWVAGRLSRKILLVRQIGLICKTTGFGRRLLIRHWTPARPVFVRFRPYYVDVIGRTAQMFRPAGKRFSNSLSIVVSTTQLRPFKRRTSEHVPSIFVFFVPSPDCCVSSTADTIYNSPDTIFPFPTVVRNFDHLNVYRRPLGYDFGGRPNSAIDRSRKLGTLHQPSHCRRKSPLIFDDYDEFNRENPFRSKIINACRQVRRFARNLFLPYKRIETKQRWQRIIYTHGRLGQRSPPYARYERFAITKRERPANSSDDDDGDLLYYGYRQSV